jgi:hypothetical protein
VTRLFACPGSSVPIKGGFRKVAAVAASRLGSPSHPHRRLTGTFLPHHLTSDTCLSPTVLSCHSTLAHHSRHSSLLHLRLTHLQIPSHYLSTAPDPSFCLLIYRLIVLSRPRHLSHKHSLKVACCQSLPSTTFQILHLSRKHYKHLHHAFQIRLCLIKYLQQGAFRRQHPHQRQHLRRQE